MTSECLNPRRSRRGSPPTRAATGLQEDDEAKHVPGFSGRASENLASKDKSDLKTGAQFEQLLGQAEDFTRKYGYDPRVWSPSAQAEGKDLASNLAQKYRESTMGGGIFRPAEAPFLDKVVPGNAAQFWSDFTVTPKLKALRKVTRQTLDNTAKSQGLGGYVGWKGSSGTPQAQQPKEIIQNGVVYDAVTKKPLRRA